MARRPAQKTGVSKTKSGTSQSASTPDTVSAPRTQVARDAAAARHVSLKEAAGLLDRDRNTITKWLDQGCPFVQRADRSLGQAWVLDIAEIVKWLEARAAASVAEKLGDTGEGFISKEEAERRTAIAKMVREERAAAEELATAVPVSVVLDRVADDYNKVRSRMMAVPDAIAGRVDQRMSDKVRDIADEQVRNALKALRSDIMSDAGAEG